MPEPVQGHMACHAWTTSEWMLQWVIAKAGFNGTMTALRLLTHARRERNNMSRPHEFVLVCAMGVCKNEKLGEVIDQAVNESMDGRTDAA